ncbi:MAG: carboxylesterase/lipase family protein, partial [Janthinobacterium lividum]
MDRNTLATRAPTRRAVLGTAGASLVAAGASVTGLRAARAAAPDPVVDTSHGRLRGMAGDGALVFKGVRYGETTGGPNRFLPPVAVTPWAGVRDAVAFGHSAPQVQPPDNSLDSWYTAIEPVSEDCLFLNVFTTSLASGTARPVMVWLHGGAWSSCAGTAPGFDGTNLARDGGVVVVTINHRLSVFGYLELGSREERFADAGNAGVLDMVAALRWVHDNIGRFGGDPGNVTIFGQSGGASKVTALLGMPAAHGLFHKAIVQSCSGGLRLTPLAEAGEQAASLVKALGQERIDGAALQGVPMETLLKAGRSVADPFRPVLDGRSFTASPYDGTATPVSSSIPMLVGNAANEATLFLAGTPANLKIDEGEAVRRIARFLQSDQAATRRIVD